VEDVEERSPPPAVWARIEAAVAAKPTVAAAPAAAPVAGQRRARGDARDAGQPRRRGGAAGLLAAALAGALAASAATVAVFAWRGVPPETLMGRPSAADATALMSATLSPTEGGEALYVATLDQERGMIVIAPARILPEAEDRSRELWVIPEGGAPYSLGLLRPGRPSALQMDPRARRMMEAGATLAVSLEPLGGSPGDGPTGPVLGAGALDQVS
jgi:anti-sigma-K factor RskA